METVNVDRDEVLILPKLSLKRIFSLWGIFRLIQLVFCLSTFIVIESSPKCIELELLDDDIVTYCIGPNIFVFRIYLAGILFTFLTTLLIYVVFITNLTAVIQKAVWDLLIYLHTVICVLLLFLLSILMAYDKFSSTTAIVGLVLGLFTWATYLYHFYWQHINIDESDPLRNQAQSEVSAESDDEDDPESDREIPTLSVVRQRVSSLESLDDAPNWPVVSEDALALSFHRASSAVSSDDSEDPRSWVISGDPDDDDVVNVTVNIKEDTMSTDTYTVDTHLDIAPPLFPRV